MMTMNKIRPLRTEESDVFTNTSDPLPLSFFDDDSSDLHGNVSVFLPWIVREWESYEALRTLNSLVRPDIGKGEFFRADDP